MRNIILDLRGNPGGLLSASVGVADVWLDRGQTGPETEAAPGVGRNVPTPFPHAPGALPPHKHPFVYRSYPVDV